MKVAKSSRSPLKQGGKHVVVAGCGNIGSFLVLLLVRIPRISKLTLVDFDRYEERNFSSQHVAPADLGKPKATVLARLAKRLNPRLNVVPIVARLEAVPPGLLRCDVMLACVDSKDARHHANEIAWRLGVPLIDAGIEASALLARVNIYRPQDGQPCLECAWDDRDYGQLNVIHPCDAGDRSATPTGAPASLGALAASLQAIECEKILSGDFSDAGRQILIEAATHKHYVTSFRRNLKCRFSHQTWSLAEGRTVPLNLTVSDAQQLTGARGESLGFAGQSLVQQMACPGCGFVRRGLKLENQWSGEKRTCPRCGKGLLAPGFNKLPRLQASELTGTLAARALASLGLRVGDIISVGSGEKEKFYELGQATQPAGTKRRTA